MVAVGRFGIAADGRPIRLGRRAFDVLVALIEALGVMVSKDALSSCVLSVSTAAVERAAGGTSPALIDRQDEIAPARGRWRGRRRFTSITSLAASMSGLVQAPMLAPVRISALAAH